VVRAGILVMVEGVETLWLIVTLSLLGGRAGGGGRSQGVGSVSAVLHDFDRGLYPPIGIGLGGVVNDDDLLGQSVLVKLVPIGLP
jgi:hypothetical protein